MRGKMLGKWASGLMRLRLFWKVKMFAFELIKRPATLLLLLALALIHHE